jgi:hypothetical protein
MAHSILSILALETSLIIRDGFDTTPQEGFEAAGIRAEFGIPKEGQVVAQRAMRLRSSCTKHLRGALWWTRSGSASVTAKRRMRRHHEGEHSHSVVNATPHENTHANT